MIFARAQWRVEKEVVDSLVKGPLHEQFAAAQRWRVEQNVPRYVALAEGDNELPIDFDNVLSVETFLHAIKNRRGFVIVEMFPTPGDLCAYGPEGRFVHELIVPFTKPSPTSRAPRRSPATSSTVRLFQPGTDWLYVKVYAGTAGVDTILTDLVSPLIRRHQDSGAADRWFFIRYGDPEWHLRLRLHGDAGRLRDEVLPDISRALSPALADRRVWKVQIDTYHREIERYGGDGGMRLSEEVFWRDSESVLAILPLLGGDQGMELRWILCLRGWDLLLTDLRFDVADKRTLAQQVRQTLGRQLNQPKLVDHALGSKFRQHRQIIEAVLDKRETLDAPLPEALHILRHRSTALEPVMRELLEEERAGHLSTPLPSLAISLLHMHANRLLRSAHNLQEFVLYDFLGRVYESKLARTRRERRAAAGV